MFCSKCGTKLPDEAAFCPKCGEKVLRIADSEKTEEKPLEAKLSEEKAAEAKPSEEKTAEAKPVEEKPSEVKTSEAGKTEDPMSNSHMFGKLLMIALNVVALIKYFGNWFSMPVLSLFSDSDAEFSFMDLIRLFFKSGRLFKATNQNFGEVLSEVPGGVKFLALILAALFFASIILIVLSIVYYVTDRATVKFQIKECGFMAATLLSFGITVLVLQKKIDDAIGMSSLGSKIIELTSSYKWLWALLVIIAVLLYYFKNNSKFSGIVEDASKEPLKITIPEAVKKKLKIAAIVLCVVLVIVGIVKIRNHFAKDSEGYSYAEIEEMLDSKKNKIDITKGHDAFPDVYDGWDSTRSYHINEADGAFVVWSCNTYDDGDGFYLDGDYYDYDCFEGETGAVASKNCDITFYVLKPGNPIDPWASCPIDNYGDGDYSMGICGISDASVYTYDDYGRQIYEKYDWADLSFGEYRIVMVCDHVKDVDIKFAYADDHCDEYGNYGASDYAYHMYYPGEY